MAQNDKITNILLAREAVGRIRRIGEYLRTQTGLIKEYGESIIKDADNLLYYSETLSGDIKQMVKDGEGAVRGALPMMSLRTLEKHIVPEKPAKTKP